MEERKNDLQKKNKGLREPASQLNTHGAAFIEAGSKLEVETETLKKQAFSLKQSNWLLAGKHDNLVTQVANKDTRIQELEAQVKSLTSTALHQAPTESPFSSPTSVNSMLKSSIGSDSSTNSFDSATTVGDAMNTNDTSVEAKQSASFSSLRQTASAFDGSGHKRLFGTNTNNIAPKTFAGPLETALPRPQAPVSKEVHMQDIAENNGAKRFPAKMGDKLVDYSSCTPGAGNTTRPSPFVAAAAKAVPFNPFTHAANTATNSSRPPHYANEAGKPLSNDQNSQLQGGDDVSMTSDAVNDDPEELPDYEDDQLNNGDDANMADSPFDNDKEKLPGRKEDQPNTKKDVVLEPEILDDIAGPLSAASKKGNNKRRSKPKGLDKQALRASFSDQTAMPKVTSKNSKSHKQPPSSKDNKIHKGAQHASASSHYDDERKANEVMRQLQNMSKVTAAVVAQMLNQRAQHDLHGSESFHDGKKALPTTDLHDRAAKSGKTPLPKTEVFINGRQVPTGPRSSRGDNAASIMPGIENNPRGAGLNNNGSTAAAPGHGKIPKRKPSSDPPAHTGPRSFGRNDPVLLESIAEELSDSEVSHNDAEENEDGLNYSGAKYGDNMGRQPDRKREGAPPPPNRHRK